MRRRLRGQGGRGGCGWVVKSGVDGEFGVVDDIVVVVSANREGGGGGASGGTKTRTSRVRTTDQHRASRTHTPPSQETVGRRQP